MGRFQQRLEFDIFRLQIAPYIFVVIRLPPLAKNAQGRDFRKSYRSIRINSFFLAPGKSIKADFTRAR